jgi:hypothetical protein
VAPRGGTQLHLGIASRLASLHYQSEQLATDILTGTGGLAIEYTSGA